MEKKLSSEEEREKMKEEYKKDLRERQRILEEIKQSQKLNLAQKGLENITNITNSLEEADEFIAKLNAKAILEQAKMEMALDSAKTTDNQTNTIISTDTNQNLQNQAVANSKTLGDEEVHLQSSDKIDHNEGTANSATPIKKSLGDIEL